MGWYTYTQKSNTDEQVCSNLKMPRELQKKKKMPGGLVIGRNIRDHYAEGVVVKQTIGEK